MFAHTYTHTQKPEFNLQPSNLIELQHLKWFQTPGLKAEVGILCPAGIIPDRDRSHQAQFVHFAEK